MTRWLAIFGLLIAASAFAHEVRPAFLELTERAPGEFDVLWKVPAMGGAPLEDGVLRLHLRFRLRVGVIAEENLAVHAAIRALLCSTGRAPTMPSAHHWKPPLRLLGRQ